MRNASLDFKACERLGIEVAMTRYVETGVPELIWAALMALARNIPVENANLCSGGWQMTVTSKVCHPLSSFGDFYHPLLKLASL